MQNGYEQYKEYMMTSFSLQRRRILVSVKSLRKCLENGLEYQKSGSYKELRPFSKERNDHLV